ncbi:FkbM family methyltransferase [Methylorubrum sp. Q1]|uniref:FkbM family methyltransferase n=1 Tax=Methylorubrum sp. Q1 TaxID=2562453 RepID=UPI001076067A|nr:FkbM family methyltransferase [Methylorubrum sp. Q1]TFZ59951.1 FkbM family methyltransferase [Methylorubrum sp. Q1]
MASEQHQQINFTFAGRNFTLDSAEGADLVARTMAEGSYEAPLPLILMAVVSRLPGRFLDVGANNGLYSILAAKSRPGVRVTAFEPLPAALDILRRNIIANSVEAQITVQECALSDDEGEATLYIPDKSHGLLETSASLEEGFKSHESTITILKQKLDNFRFDDQISVVKVDIEGHEASFFRGALRYLKTDRPIIFAEMLAGARREFYSLSKLLSTVDYIPFRLRPTCAIHTPFISADMAAWNYAMIPVDKIDLFCECCRVHGLEVFSEFKYKF